MEKKTSNKPQNKRVVIISLIALIVAVGVFVAAYMLLRDKPAEGTKNISVEIVYADGSDKTVDIKTDAEYLKKALDEKNLIAGSGTGEMFFITTVDGVEANEANQEWWSITKDGEWVMTGVSTTPIEDGDHFELTLTVGW